MSAQWVNQCHFGDCLETLKRMPDGIAQTCVTSPPYFGLRSYGGGTAEIGKEKTPEEFVAALVAVFREVRRVLRDDGCAWINMGDSYGKGKQLLGIPWRLAFALQDDGWILRQEIVWAKPNPMPESVQGSHYSRHRVTIEEYENLSNLQYTDERLGDDWAGDMPSLSEREKVSCKAPLSAKYQGAGNSQGEGATGRCPRKTAGVQPVGAGSSQQGAARKNGEGHQDAQSGYSPIQGDAQSENYAGASPSENKKQSCSHCAEAVCRIQIHPKPEGEGAVEAHECTAQGCNTFDNESADSGGLGVDRGGKSGLVPLLRDAEKVDAGSCDPVEQGGAAHERERGSGVPAVQLEKEQQDSSLALVGCPGCPKCIQHHGYIFHLSAGRCTKSHESIFLLAKQEKYYFDSGAIKEPASKGAAGSDFHTGKTGEHQLGRASEKLRSKRDSFKRDESKRAEVIPGQTVGTHRHDRQESEWDTETRNKRSVWTVATTPYKGAHFATFPTALIEPCILAGAPSGGVVLDPFGGSGTTAQVAQSLGRKWILCELNEAYRPLIEDRTVQPSFDFQQPCDTADKDTSGFEVDLLQPQSQTIEMA